MQGILAALKKKYPEIKSPAGVTPALGIANAYDALHLTAPRHRQGPARSTGPRFREGFYAIDSYDGLIKSYDQPFTPQNQDALRAFQGLHLHTLRGRRDTSR